MPIHRSGGEGATYVHNGDNHLLALARLALGSRNASASSSPPPPLPAELACRSKFFLHKIKSERVLEDVWRAQPADADDPAAALRRLRGLERTNDTRLFSSTCA